MKKPIIILGLTAIASFTDQFSHTVLAQSPSFDCSQADGEVENLICQDTELAQLDLKMEEVYTTAYNKAGPEMKSTLQAEQIGWIKGRNECWKSEDVGTCVEDSYLYRISELQSQYQLVGGTEPVFYTCNNTPANEIVATFYESDIPSVILERGDTVIVGYLQPAASGSLYEGRNVSFWVKGNEASVTWLEEELNCVSPQ